MDTSSLMKQILSSDNLNRAYLQVVRNKGAEGVDGMKYTELKEHLAKNGEIIKEQLRTRKYKPQPVRRVEMDCQHFFRQIFLGYFSDIVQAFDTLRKNVCGDDYTSLHNPIVLSSVLPAYGMFHSIQILFL